MTQIDPDDSASGIATSIDRESPEPQQLRSRLIAVLEATSDLVGLADPRTKRVLYLNQAGHRMLGIEADATKHSFTEFHPPAELKVIEQHAHPIAAREGIWKGQSILRSLQGREYPVSMVISAHYTQSGELDCISAIARDITEEKRVEETLHASERMLRLVLDTIPARVFWKDRSSVYLGGNMLFAKDAGLGTASELVGKVDSQLAWSDQADRYRQDDRRFMDLGEAQFHYEEPQTTPDGRTITLRTSKVPLRNDEGGVIGILGVYDDITDLKQAEASLRLSEAALRAAANVVLITDRAGCIVWTNPAFTRETGYGAKEVLGKNPRLLKSGEHPPEFYGELWKCIREGRVWHGELHNRRKDGTLLIEDATITPVLDDDGKITHFIAVKQNINRRKQAESALRASEQEYRTMFELASIGMAQADPHTGRLLRVNQKLCAITGYAPDQLLQLRIGDITHPDDRAQDFQALQRMVRGEIQEYHVEKRYLRKPGGIAWGNVNVSLVRNADGNPKHTLATIEDITERKSAEDALRKSEAALREAHRLTKLGNWEWDLEAGQHTWSSEVFNIYGRDPALGPAGFEEVPQYFTAESWSRLCAAVETALAHGQAYECDAEVVRPDGSRRWITARGEANRNAAGKVTSLHGTVQDITDRKRAEVGLAQLGQRNELILRSAAEGILGLDLQGNHTFVNPSALEMLGFESHELIGRPGHGNWHHTANAGDSRAQAECEICQAYRDGQVHRKETEVFWRKDGTSFPVEYASTPIYESGRLAGAVVTFRDITERKQKEEALEQRVKLQDQLARVAATVPGMVYSFKRATDGTYSMPFASAALETLFGLSPGEVAEDAGPVFARVHPDDLQQLVLSVSESARTLSPWRAEFRVRQTRLGEIWIEGNSIPQREPDGSVLWYGFLHDVTVRKTAEATERRNQEAKIRNQNALLKLTSHPRTSYGEAVREILQTDALALGVGRVSYWALNEEATAITCEALYIAGTDRWEHGTELHRRDFPDYFHALEANPFIASREAQTDPRTHEFAECYLRPQGIVSMLDVPVWLRGKLVGVVCHEQLQVCRDWTSEEQDFALSIGRMVALALGERELALREQRLDSFFRNAAAGLCILDEHLRFVRINETLARINGRPVEEHLGQQLDQILPGIAAELAPTLARVRDRGEVVLNLEVSGETPAQPGIQRHWSTSYFPLVTAPGNPRELGSVVIEITERKRAEERLRESERFLQSTLDSLSNHIAILDESGEILAVNAVWNAFAASNAGKPESCGVGANYLRVCTAPVAGDAEGAAQAADGIQNVIGGEHGFQMEYACHSPTEKRWFNMRVTRFAGEGPVRVVVAHENITARIWAEQEHQAIEVQLRHAQKLESIGQLAAGIAHEINTPTQYIGDNTKFIRDGLQELLPVLATPAQLLAAIREERVTPELLSATEAILQAADLEYLGQELPAAIEQSLQGVERVAKIVRAMKEFSHPGTTEKTHVDLNHAIESTLTVARNEWKYVADLVTEFDPELPQVKCLPGEFNQVILNLVVNAAHAIADTLNNRDHRKGTITVSTKLDGDWVEVRVRDTGTGIPEPARPRIFDPFFTTKAVGKGTGQGLAIARSVVVDKHGGTISFETETGRGTVFIIRLPVAGQALATQERA